MKNNRFRNVVLAFLAVGIILPMSNPSEDQHKDKFYSELRDSDRALNKVIHTTAKASDFLSNIFGTRSALVYENYLLFSLLKIDDGTDDGITVSVGILGNVFTSVPD